MCNDKHHNCCEHEHTGCSCHSEAEEKNEKLLLVRIALSAALLIAAIFNSSVLLYMLSYIIIGYDIILKSIKNIIKGKVFDENLLMSIASIGALLIGEHPEGVAVMLLYQLGELLQDKAVDKSERSIEALLDVRADTACVERDGNLIELKPEDVKCNEILIVKTGEKVPLDGIVTDGVSQLDTSALTGESVPVPVKPDSEILGGSLNLGNTLKVKVTKEYNDSAISKILKFVNDARSKKPKTERFITRFAKYYTPVVVILALFTMTVPPLFDGFSFLKWIERGLIFLVVSCPCALVISVPLGFFSAMGAASRNGILIKGGEYIEWLSKLDTAVFDKTGTLTKGVFKVTDITGDKAQTLHYAAYCECFSNHPLAKAVMNEYGKSPDTSEILEHEEFAGMGVRAVTASGEILAGNNKLMRKFNIDCPDNNAQIHVARNRKYIGSVTVSDELKTDSEYTVSTLKSAGVKTVMLTGDKKESVEKTADCLGIDIVMSELLPHEKAEAFQKLNGIKIFVGDGINDAPVISAAHVGFAMGGSGSDSAIETADAVILTDEPSKAVAAYRLSKRAMFIIKENIIFSISVKLAAMLLSILGVPNMIWFAIFADVGTAMIAIANSMRILYLKVK